MGVNRFQHRLKDNKTSEFPYHFIFFDTETTQVKRSDVVIEHILKLGVALYWRRADAKVKEILEYRNFTKPQQFWEFVFSKCTSKRRIVIISHNLPFDMGVVKGWRYLSRFGFIANKIILDYQCNIWRFRKNTITLLFIDNMNFFQTSLEVLGKSLGITKGIMPNASDNIRSWRRYCKRDVDILLTAWRTWYEFLSSNDLGSFGYTIASQAFNAFRHRFMPIPISIHTSNKATILERRSYRGGRNECFRIGQYSEEPFYLVDVNAMYPFVMKTAVYPHNLISTGSALSLDKAKTLLLKYSIIADCVINTREPCYGVKLTNKLLFPTGEFLVTLTSKEISHAITNNHLVRIQDYALYENARLFSDYVTFFYNSRLNFAKLNNPAYVYLCKLFLNSLYGKFGQKIEDWKYVCDDKTRDYDWWQEYDYQRREVFTYRCINSRVEVSTGHHEGFNSLVAIASEVTANARLVLWELIKQAGVDNVYYCDTDSLIINGSGLHALHTHLSETKIGGLKLVDTADTITISNLKDYSFGGKVKIKGIRKDAEMIAYNKYKQYQNIGIKSGLHLKDINRVTWRIVVKTLSRKYEKGTVLDDGRVIPYDLSYHPNQSAILQK